uniref:Guanylate cyclase activator 1C n=1 Tax=Hucho hucho TaxID=62062 RepID=A0A4W5L0L1_9TELE
MGAYESNLDDILAEDMHHWYNKFMKESPSGLITLFELKTMLEMQGMSEEASSYVDQVFFTFDMDGDGYIDFVEYIAAVSLMLKGEINQKLKWYFKLFDQDGNGKIDQDEMGTIFKVGFYIYLLFLMNECSLEENIGPNVLWGLTKDMIMFKCC